MIKKVLPHLRKYTSKTDSVPMILGGDFNTQSHLDWGEGTKKQHNDLVVPWYSIKVLGNLELADTYRTLYQDPITDPGIT